MFKLGLSAFLVPRCYSLRRPEKCNYGTTDRKSTEFSKDSV